MGYNTQETYFKVVLPVNVIDRSVEFLDVGNMLLYLIEMVSPIFHIVNWTLRNKRLFKWS